MHYGLKVHWPLQGQLSPQRPKPLVSILRSYASKDSCLLLVRICNWSMPSDNVCTLAYGAVDQIGFEKLQDFTCTLNVHDFTDEFALEHKFL